jgi:O-antigen/teichoic acid export membrane protein
MNVSNDPLRIRHLFASLRGHFSGRGGLQAVIQNSGWLLFDRFVRVLVGMFVNVWVARYLGVAQYGQLAYILAYLTFFQVVATLGMDAIVVREIAIKKNAAAEILGTAAFLRVLSGFLLWGLAILVMVAWDGWRSDTVWLVALAGGALVFQAAETVDLWFQSQSKSRLTVLAKLTAYVLSAILKVAAIFLEAPVWVFVALFAVEMAVSCVGLIVIYHKAPCEERWRKSFMWGRTLLRESWPFMLSGLSVTVYMRIDQIMIRDIIGEAALGVYAVVLTLSNIWHVIPMTLNISLAPYVARKRSENQLQYRQAMIWIFRSFFYSALACAVITRMTSGWLVSSLYGSQYLAAIQILDIHVFSNLFIFLGVAHSLWLINERRFLVRLIGTLAAAGVSVLTNYWLLPLWGLLGACVATISSQMIAGFLINAIMDREGFKLQLQAISLRGST